MKFANAWRLSLVAVSLFLMTGCLINNDSTPTPIPTSAPTQPPASPTVPGPPSVGEVTIFADSSLQSALDAMQGVVQSQGITRARYTYDLSQVLAAQISQGIKPDIFIADSLRTVQSVAQTGQVVSGTEQLLVTAKLMLVTPPPPQKGQPAIKVHTLADLAQPGIKISVADPETAAGAYTTELLDKLAADPAYGPDFKTKVFANISSREGDMGSVVSKVQQSQVDAGFAYLPDAKATIKPMFDANNVQRFLPVHTLDIPDKDSVTATFYIAAVKDAPNAQGGQRYMDYLLSEQGQNTLEGYGFGPRTAAAGQ